MQFLGAGLQAAETLIPEAAFVAEPLLPGTGDAPLAPALAAGFPQQAMAVLSAERGQATAQSMPAGTPLPEAKTITAAVVPSVASIPAQPSAAVATAAVAVTAPEPQITHSQGTATTQVAASADPSDMTVAPKRRVTIAPTGQTPQTIPGTAQPTTVMKAATPAGPDTLPDTDMNPLTNAARKGAVSVETQAPVAKIETQKPAITPQPITPEKPVMIPRNTIAVAAAVNDRTDQALPLQNRATAPRAQVDVSTKVGNIGVEKQSVATIAQPDSKVAQTGVVAQKAKTDLFNKPMSSSMQAQGQPTAAVPPAQEMETVAAAPKKPATVPVATAVAQQSTTPATTQAIAQQTQRASVIRADMTAQAKPLRPGLTIVPDPVKTNEPETTAKPAVVNAGPAPTLLPKTANVAAPVAVPTTNEQGQAATPITVVEKTTAAPASPAQITTIQAVAAQRELLRPQGANTTSDPAASKADAAPVRTDAQQPVFEAPTGQGPTVQAKPETNLATVAGPIGSAFDPIDPILAPRPDAAAIQSLDPENAVKMAAPQDTAPKAPPKPFAEALISQVKSVEVREGRTSVSLHPRGLGNIEIEVVTEKDTTAKVVVRVENPAVLQSLRDERDLLAQAIGVSDSSIFEFHDHQPDDPSGGQGGQSQSSGQLTEISSATDTAAQHTDVVGDGQLDILT